MRKLSADLIFPIHAAPIAGGVLILNDHNEVVDLLHSAEGMDDVEYHHGILCPGFVNTHCHLELSHLKGKVEPGGGLVKFILNMMGIRFGFEPTEVAEACAAADAEMRANGIVAVGDISNGADSFAAKLASEMHYHTFIERFGFDGNAAHGIFDEGVQLMEQYRQLDWGKRDARVSITPHAPYSVSEKLFKLIGDTCYADGSPIAMHNQETAAENEMFQTGKSALIDMLQQFGLFTEHWTAPGFNSLPSVMVHLPRCNPILLVHNTFSTAEDIEWAHKYSNVVYWCTCPRANSYIEERLPDYTPFLEADARMTIGTDSLASNWSLSVLEELKLIAQHNPTIGLHTLLTWATKNGADVLGLKRLGTLETGKKPGVNLLTGIDLNTLELSEAAAVQPLT